MTAWRRKASSSGLQLMATRQERIVHEGAPPTDQPREILCEDHVGRYVIPFLCQWRDGVWQNAKTKSRVEVTVIGWREPKENQR